MALVACALENDAMAPRQEKSLRRGVQLFRDILGYQRVVIGS
jgi:hypothetical protein